MGDTIFDLNESYILFGTKLSRDAFFNIDDT
jgi:hypothetical protein